MEKPKQTPNYRQKLADLVNGALAERGWIPAQLAKTSRQSPSTISRITSYDTTKNPNYRPRLETVQAIAQALKLNTQERRELFYTAKPEFAVWDEAAENGYTVDKTNDILFDKGLPLLTSDN